MIPITIDKDSLSVHSKMAMAKKKKKCITQLKLEKSSYSQDSLPYSGNLAFVQDMLTFQSTLWKKGCVQ